MKLYDALDRAEKAATPGPWETVTRINYSKSKVFVEGNEVRVTVDKLKFPPEDAGHDADLIALSRNHLRKLLDLWYDAKALTDGCEWQLKTTDLASGHAEHKFMLFMKRLAALDIEVESGQDS